MTTRSEALFPAWVQRVDTDGRTVADVAAEVITLTGWDIR